MVASELTASAKAMGSIPVEDPTGAAATEHSAPLQNRARHSLNPFIRGYANSPVPWQLLSNATVERARKEHKLIFMHIGYKSCHHCHLMATESFSTPECASVLSEHFIPVVVDRDERPDLGTIYMNYVQAVSNSGGWPLNLFLTPNLEPVFGGTYWPCPTSVRRTSGESGDEILDFLTIVKKVRNIWRDQEARCRKEATEVVGQLKEFAAEGTLGTRSLTSKQQIPPSGASTPSIPVASSTRRTAAASELDLDQLEEAYTHIAGTFDPVCGGFGLAPKFITSPKLAFLMQLSRFPTPVQDVVGEKECDNAFNMALNTLRQVRDGALRDHVGGNGFARFSVTPDWSIPNFEKSVVDNALLLSLFLEAWKRCGAQENGEFLDVVLELADYLTSPPVALPNGALASSEAADSQYKKGDGDLHEGAFYLWTRREFDSVVETAVDKQASQIAAAYFGVLEDGNVDEDHDPNDDFINQNIIRVRRTVEDLSARFNIPVSTIDEYIQGAKAALKARRDRERIRPELDAKVVTGWNGLIISALARAGAALKLLRAEQSSRYLTAARRAVTFIKEKLWDADAKILYRIWNEERSVEGFADDYAYLVLGLLDLFDATGDESLLEFADTLQKTQISLFYDAAGAFYTTTVSSPHTILRLKDGMDTDLPSTNTTSVSNLFRLGDLLEDESFTTYARETIDAFEAEMLQHPWLFPGLLSGVVAVRLGVEKSGVDVKYKATRVRT